MTARRKFKVFIKFLIAAHRFGALHKLKKEMEKNEDLIKLRNKKIHSETPETQSTMFCMGGAVEGAVELFMNVVPNFNGTSQDSFDSPSQQSGKGASGKSPTKKPASKKGPPKKGPEAPTNDI